ncbi:hypothetical protein [uncultured Cytophaga sp.]|nr:hypothetical protein [uncultured Cytophaga sp.]
MIFFLEHCDLEVNLLERVYSLWNVPFVFFDYEVIGTIGGA